MGHSRYPGERRKDFGAVKFVSHPEKSGFLGHYPLNGHSEKNYELPLEEFPEEAYWCRIKRNHLNVYKEEVVLSKRTEKELKKIMSRHLSLEVQRGMGTIQYEYKWE